MFQSTRSPVRCHSKTRKYLWPGRNIKSIRSKTDTGIVTVRIYCYNVITVVGHDRVSGDFSGFSRVGFDAGAAKKRRMRGGRWAEGSFQNTFFNDGAGVGVGVVTTRLPDVLRKSH